MSVATVQGNLFGLQQRPEQAAVKVIGVGGAGCKAVSETRKKLAGDCALMCIDTDAMSLERSACGQRLLLGAATLRGFGSGGDVSQARKLAAEQSQVVRRFVDGAGCVIVVSGVSGATGAGVAPVVAETASETGALVLSVAVMPLDFEPVFARLQAADTLDRLRLASDAVLETPRADTRHGMGGRPTLRECFRSDRDFVTAVVEAMVSIASPGPGRAGAGLGHLRSLFCGGAPAVFASAAGQGHAGAMDAVGRCLESVFKEAGPANRPDSAFVLIESAIGVPASRIGAIVAAIELRCGPGIQLEVGVRQSLRHTGTLRVSLISTLLQATRLPGPRLTGEVPYAGITASRRPLARAGVI